MPLSRALAAAGIGLALLATPAHAAKTDVVVLKNGDHITGEVQQLERGRLSFKTDDLGTINIEWDKIASIAATAPFDVDDLAGNRYLGSLVPGPVAGQLQIVWKGNTDSVELASVYRLARLDTSFWARLDGSIDLGASYTSASELAKLDFTGTLGVQRPGYGLDLDASATLTTQPGVDDTKRSTASATYTRRFRDLWVGLASVQVEQNRELGFDLRSSATGGGGKYLVQSQQDRLLAGVGLSLNRERPVEGEFTTNVEAAAFIAYDRFSYDSPKVDVSVVATGFASLNDSGRYRLELEALIKRELVKDFYATLRGYESYDSRPATEGSVLNDYGVTFALGWSF